MAFQGFRAKPSISQAVTSGGFDRMNFGTTVFDTESGFGSNIYTVPAGLNGKYMVFSAGIYLGGVANTNLYIRVSTDGGATYDSYGQEAAYNTHQDGAVTVSSGPVLVSTGMRIEVWIFVTTAGRSIAVDDRNFFSGAVLPDTFQGFRAKAATTQIVSNTEIQFATEEFDTEAAFASHRFTVPAGLNGKYMVFFANIRATSNLGNGSISLQRSTDGGSIWTLDAYASCQSSSSAITLASGLILLTTGHIYRVVYAGSGSTINNGGNNSAFSGYVVDP